jgi:soluble lytic murein transglycosylase
MMLLYWATTIRARWSSRAVCGAFALLVAASCCGGATLESLTRAFQKKHTPANRAALLRFAEAHPKDTDGALALLTLAIAERRDGQPVEALAHLARTRARLPRLADYVAYYSAAAKFDLGQFAVAARELDPVWNNAAPSPLTGDAAMLAARAWQQAGKPAEAVRVLRDNYTRLPQPAGDLLLAAAYRASNDLTSACVYYQRVYFQSPNTPEAGQAASALTQLQAMLGELYPPPMTQAMFERAQGWVRAREFAKARAEYEAAANQAAGEDRELALVRLAALDYFRYENASAFSKLKALNVSTERADAERLYYLLECARRLDRYDQFPVILERLAKRHPASPWRVQALISVANRYLIDNRPELYEPLYRACYESFPSAPRADYCHWKVTWRHYITRRPDATDYLREHLTKYPDSDQAIAALYYLGRLAETAGRPQDAKTYYSEAVARFPNSYYADLAEKRLSVASVSRAADPPDIQQFLDSVHWSPRRVPGSFEPTAATRLRVERARQLDSAGLYDLCERELRFGAQTDGQSQVLAIQLAQSITRSDSTHRALRTMKGLVPGYIYWPLDSAPAEFWHLLFPLPYRSALETYSRRMDIDPFLVAGLIRQESEFNPKAVSSARAYGLTQILPSTGRALLKMSRRRFHASILFRPDVNLRLGAMHLRHVYNQSSDRWEVALATYNAGATRVQSWLTWADFREPSEFIETIPFSETRHYVFAVLRNAEIYRKLYASTPSGPATQARKPAPTKKRRTKR